MVLRIVRGQNLPIGVDLGSSALKMVQLRRVNEELTLIDACTAALPETGDDLDARLEAQADAIRRMLRARQFKGRTCILSVPARDTLVQHVKIPKLAQQELETAIAGELAGKLPYPPEQAIIRHAVLGETHAQAEPMIEVLTVSMSRELMDAYLAMTGRAKLDVVGVGIECCAIVECFARLFRRASERTRTVLLVDVGAHSTQVALAQGGTMRFARNLAMGCDDLDESLGKTLGVDATEAARLRRAAPAGEDGDPKLQQALDASLARLSRELTQCLRYYESVFLAPAVERVMIVGGGAADARLCQSLGRQLNLPASEGDPLVRVRRRSDQAASPQPDWAVAVGLSLGADAN
ncbi:MAG: pilus assembly protein PilM [Planctomycetaceae bacterium]|nr:pilus assembly protein PilM [Planctomycetaceae bacterium]